VGPDGQPIEAKEDTGPTGDEDTGVTREQLIDEMIEDVAQDTGLTAPEKTQMADALLHIRDAQLEPTPETP